MSFDITGLDGLGRGVFDGATSSVIKEVMETGLSPSLGAGGGVKSSC
jgi:hypothetical protein